MSRPMSISVREMRAHIVHDALLAHPELVERVEDIARLPRLAGWTDAILGDAVDRLVAEGAIAESPDGRLRVRSRRAA
jgi:hypothetical protein